LAIVDLAALVVILEFLLKRSIGVGAAETLGVTLGRGVLVTSCTHISVSCEEGRG